MHCTGQNSGHFPHGQHRFTSMNATSRGRFFFSPISSGTSGTRSSFRRRLMMSMADMGGIVRRQAVPCKPPEVVMAASEVLGLDHVDLTVNDLEVSVAFYAATLGRLGFRRVPHAS